VAFGECKRDTINVEATWEDLRSYFQDGLPSLFYQAIPFIPVFVATGNKLQFGILSRGGKVRFCGEGDALFFSSISKLLLYLSLALAD